MNAATIAIFEKDAETLKEITEKYCQDAERFWSTMARENTNRRGAGGNVEGDGVTDSDEEEGQGQTDTTTQFPKLQRTKVWKWLLVTWHMMKTIVAVGWDRFMVPVEIAERGPAADWPSLTIALDQGGDGWSAGQPTKLDSIPVPSTSGVA